MICSTKGVALKTLVAVCSRSNCDSWEAITRDGDYLDIYYRRRSGILTVTIGISQKNARSIGGCIFNEQADTNVDVANRLSTEQMLEVTGLLYEGKVELVLFPGIVELVW